MTAKRPTRRDFLQGRAAARTLAEAARRGVGKPRDASLGDRPEGSLLGHQPPGERAGLLVSLRRRAMACEFEVQLPAGRDDDSTATALAALDLVGALENQMTVYRADSEMIQINRRAAEAPVTVESRLFGLLQMAERLHEESAGAFDITSGPLAEIWGFSRRAGRLPSDTEIAAALQRVGMNNVILDAAAGTVAFRRPGVTLHLNSIGKGYALDRMAALLDESGVHDYLLHGGRSSVFARGNSPGSERAGWTIGVRHPLRPDEYLAEFYVVDQALGTSGSGTQFFEQGGRRYGHLLDPRTGWPATGIFTATVVAPTAAEADALSTAFYIMGGERVAEFCSQRSDVAAMLVCSSDRTGDVSLVTCGLDDRRWRRLAGG